MGFTHTVGPASSSSSGGVAISSPSCSTSDSKSDVDELITVCSYLGLERPVLVVALPGRRIILKAAVLRQTKYALK